ncbi:MAG: hypothetical protein GWN58_20445, partial [Anaerolineae bacterium]|nr:hypothetical protein [Anaerolineae bacterium]
EAVWQEVERLDNKQPAEQQLQVQLKLMRLGRRSTRWVIRNRRTCVNTEAEVNTLQPLLQQLLDTSIEFYSTRLDEGDSDMAGYRAMGLSDYAAMLVDSANDLFFAFGMADTSIRTGASIERVNEVYSGLGELLHFEWFSQQITALPSASRWEDFAR